jgi:hypothetical protein
MLMSSSFHNSGNRHNLFDQLHRVGNTFDQNICSQFGGNGYKRTPMIVCHTCMDYTIDGFVYIAPILYIFSMCNRVNVYLALWPE